MKQRVISFYHQALQHKEIIIAIVAAILLSTLTVAIFLKNPGSLQKKPSSSISVDGGVSAPASQTVAQKGDELNWHKSIGIGNENMNVDGTIVEEIDENQEFSGDVRLPTGWTIQYSCDARGTPEGNKTYSNTPSCPTSEVTYLKLSTGTAQTLKPFSQTPVAQPVDELTQSNGSYKSLPPIVFDNKAFQIMQAVTVEDAGSSADYTLNCFDLTTYTTCTGVTFPTYISATVGALGTGPKNINTPLNMQSYVDDGSNGNVDDRGKLYFPGQHGNAYGAVCVDLLNLTNCGFTVLGTSGSSYAGIGNPVLLSGFVRQGSKLFGHANDADKANQTVVCLDLNSDGSGLDAPCSDYSANTLAPTPTYWIPEHANSYYTTGNHVLDNGKMYWIVNYSSRNSNAGNIFPPTESQRSVGTVITCFNVNTKSTCSGWPNNFWGGVNLLGTGGGLYAGLERPTTLLAWRNTDGSVRAMCLMVGLASGVDPALNCYDVANGNLLGDVNGTPGHAARMFPSGWIFFFWTGSPYVTDVTDNEGSKTYIPMYNTGSDNSVTAAPSKGATICWNWTTASRCDGFPDFGPRYWHEINSGASGDLGYFYDGACMWGVGNGNKMWSFNAKTGEAPCRVARAKYTASLKPSDFYCDGQDHIFNWGKVRLAKASMYDFESLNVTVKNATGTTVLKEGNLKDNAELDLSNITYEGNEQLYVEVSATSFSTSPWANSNVPFVNVIASSDNAQYCYKTTAKRYCDVSQLLTQTDASVVTDIDTLTQSQSTQIGLNQPQNEQCFKDVKVSVNSDKTDINGGDEVTYTILVESKGNANEFNRGNVNGARIEATLPANFSYVSSSNGGQLSGDKIVWDNQDISAGNTISQTVTIKAPDVLSFLRRGKANKAYAATTQTPITLAVAVIAGDDIYQDDNTAQNNNVVLTTFTADPPDEPEDPGDPENPPTDPGGSTTDPGGGNTDPGGGTTNPGGGTTNPGTGNNGGGTTTQPNTVIDPTTPSARGNTAPAGSNEVTPYAIKKIVPPSLASQSDSFFSAVNSAATAVPPTVAVAIPYGTIAFLIAFAAIYFYQALQAGNSRRAMRKAQERFKRTEELRTSYVDLTSHYVNTPIATMRSTLDLLVSKKELPETTASAANQRLERLVSHAGLLLSGSEKVNTQAQVAASVITPADKKRPLFNTGIILPIIGVLIVTLLVNATFVWVGKYDASTTTLIVQSSYYILSALALVIAFNIYRNQQFAATAAEQELNLEQQLTSSQTNFINSASATLEDDITELEQLAPAVLAVPQGKTFASGLSSLKNAIAKLSYLNALTTHSIVPTIPNQTIQDLAEEIIADLQSFADQNSVTVNVDIEPGLTVLVDIDGFRQILSSTLHNAIKFNRPGGTVDLSIKQKNNKRVSVVIKDTGHGIDKAKLDRLFTPFGRGSDSRKFDFEGFGLDLYMNKLIAEQCGGSISVASHQGEGTVVTVVLPS